jgi:hypothetical protein
MKSQHKQGEWINNQQHKSITKMTTARVADYLSTHPVYAEISS